MFLCDLLGDGGDLCAIRAEESSATGTDILWMLDFGGGYDYVPADVYDGGDVCDADAVF